MAAEHKGEIPIAMVIPIPTDIPDLVMGLEAWMEMVLFDPAGTQHVMDKIIPFYIRLVNGFFAAGATFVVMQCEKRQNSSGESMHERYNPTKIIMICRSALQSKIESLRHRRCAM